MKPEKKLLNEVLEELIRQQELYPGQTHHIQDWYAILGEELGEMADEDPANPNWRTEAIQCAAVLMNMILAIDSGADIPTVSANQMQHRSELLTMFKVLGYSSRLHMQTFYGQS